MHTTLGPLFKLAEAVLELYLPIVMAQVIDRGVVTGDTAYVYRMGGVMLGIVIVGLACALVCQYVASVASQGFGTELRNAVFSRVNELSHAQIDRFGVSSLINRVTGDVTQLQTAVAMLIRLVVRAPFLCIGGMVMAVAIDWRLSLVILVAIPLFVVIITLVMKITVRLHRVVQQRLDSLGRVLRENLSGVRVIRAFARTEREQRRFADAADSHADAAIRVGRLSACLNPLTQLIMNLAILAIVWFGNIRVQAGRLTTGEIIAFINYINMILHSLIVVANLVILFTKAYASAGRVAEVLETDPAIPPASSAPSMKWDVAAPAVEFDHVSFAYADTEPTDSSDEEHEDDLIDINVSIPQGAMVGIIGGTGSGKSTLMHLLLRFYDVRQGAVCVGGVDVREIPLPQLRAMMGVVPQYAELFTGTVVDNIRWGNPDATDGEIRRAAAMAQAAEFIERLPAGYDSPVERGGANFSGGQKQRLTIARALVRRPRILILDDASSALDYATDAALRKAIDTELRAGDSLTVFVVSQRVSTVRRCGLILVMDDGRLAGAGSHEELLASCPVYREICDSQQTDEEETA